MSRLEANGMRHIIIASSLFLISPRAFARWEKVEEAPAVECQRSVDYQVNADGTYTMTFNRTVEIRMDAARKSFGTMFFEYAASVSRLVQVQAETITDGQIEKVSPQSIEDKPQAKNYVGFDRINRVTIAFPKVKVGA